MGVLPSPSVRDDRASVQPATAQFFADARTGQLPAYAFIEPQITGYNHNEMHPPYSGLLSAVTEQREILDPQDVHFDNPSSLIAGEELLARIYHAIRTSS